jgi:maleylpyruvate isomerase
MFATRHLPPDHKGDVSITWPTMGPEASVAVEGCRQSHTALLAAVSELTDEQARSPSLLPGWSIGHVLTHIARNGDSVVRRLSAASQGRIVDQYVGGREGRNREIEEGAFRPAKELVEDLRHSNAAVDQILLAYPADAWERPTRHFSGRQEPALSAVFARWREVEVHHVDLGFGYRPADWPDELVEHWLPSTAQGLTGRADPHELWAWLMGRAPAPELGPWA